MGYFRERWRAPGGYRQVLVLAVPLILTTSSWTIQQFVDRMFLAWYSPEAIAAAVPGGLLNFSVMSLFIGTAGYVSTFVAQYYGAGRYHRIGPAVWQGIYVSLIGGLTLIALAPLAPWFFHLVGHGPNLETLEIQYFQILCLGAFPAIGNAAISGFYTGLGKPWPVMWLNILNTVINLTLDWALIFGHWGFPEMGMRGAGLATVIAATVTFILFMVLLTCRGRNPKYHTLSGWRPDRILFARLLRFGIPSGVEFFFDMFSFTLFVLIVGRLGAVDLAATNIALNINMLAFLPMIGSGFAVSVLVGQFLGANQPELAEKSTWSGFHLCFLYMVTVAAGYVIFPDVFIFPFAAKADPAGFAEIHKLTVYCLYFMAVFSVADPGNVIFSSALKGAGDTRFLMISLSSLALGVMVIPTYAAVTFFGKGLLTAWTFVTLYVIILAVNFFLRFRGGKWKTMRVIEPALLVKPDQTPVTEPSSAA